MAVYICSWLHRSADLVWEACLSRASFHLCWYELQISDGFLRLGKTVRVSPVSRVTRHTWHAGLCLCQEGVMLQCCYIQLIMSPWPGHTAHIEPISPSSFYTQPGSGFNIWYLFLCYITTKYLLQQQKSSETLELSIWFWSLESFLGLILQTITFSSSKWIGSNPSPSWTHQDTN